jgi:SAM-dependent methyltransferase
MEIFTLNKDTEESIRGMLNSIQNNVEFEIRLGKYIFNKETKKVSFESNVEIQFFYRLRNILKCRGINYENSYTEESIYNGNFNSKGVTKKITEYDINNQESPKIYYQYKNTFKKYDVREYEFRVSLANEKIIQKPENNSIEMSCPSIIRKKTRTSFFIDIGKIDLTIVQEFDGQHQFLQTKYEIEIEISSNQVQYEKLVSLLSVILQTRQENFFVIPSSERRNAFNEYKNLVGASFFVGAQAETLQKENINILYKELYSVTDKADGERYFLFIDSNGLVYMLDSNICSILKTNLVCKEFASTLIDCELVKHSTYMSFHAFDILFHKGQDLREDSKFLLPKRLELLENVILSIPKNPMFVFVMKRFIFRNVFIGSEVIMSSADEKEYKNDGLIFTPMNEPYPKKKKWPKLLKWKPSEKNSIDFYAMKTKSENGIGYWNLYVQHIQTEDTKSNDTHTISTQLALFDVEKLCGVPQSVEMFSTSFEEHIIDTFTGESFQTHTVIEFVWDQNQRKFVPMRTRWDKTINPKKHGNFSSVALSIWNTIHNPISLEFLSRFSNVSANNFFFEQMRRYHNKVKEYLYNTNCKNAKNILELCSGKGGDLHKWIANDIQNVTGYDISQSSIDECYKRIKEMNKGKFKQNYKFYQLDLNSEQSGNIINSNANNELYDSIVCQFGFHYFSESEESIRKIISIVNDNLQENGRFILTFMDNVQLNKMFGKSDMIYTLSEQNDIIYFMKRQMNGTPFGNKLKIYLNGNNVLSDFSYEYIIDFSVLCKLLEEYNLELVETKLFKEKYDEIPIDMVDYEKDISYLNRFCVFQKKSKKDVEIHLKNEKIETIVENVIEKEYKLINVESQNIQLHKIETIYDIIDIINCIEYSYNKLNYTNKEIEGFDDIHQIFEKLSCKYKPYFLNKLSEQHMENSIVFYHNIYTVEKINKSDTPNENQENANVYKNWYILLFNNKFVVHSELCKEIKLEENITNETEIKVKSETETKVKSEVTTEVTNETETKVKSEVDYKLYTIKQLQEELKKMGLKVSGKKAELIERIQKTKNE